MTQRGARKHFQQALRAKGVEVVEFDFLTPEAVADYCYERGFLQVRVLIACADNSMFGGQEVWAGLSTSCGIAGSVGHIQLCMCINSASALTAQQQPCT
jgi:hypothetical protein